MSGGTHARLRRSYARLNSARRGWRNRLRRGTCGRANGEVTYNKASHILHLCFLLRRHGISKWHGPYDRRMSAAARV